MIYVVVILVIIPFLIGWSLCIMAKKSDERIQSRTTHDFEYGEHKEKKDE